MMERLKTMAILALLAALAGSIALAATSGEAEVRITARQLEDGRVEFGLQQRMDGEWGERTLPSSRYFPADVGHNRWLNSTPMTVSVSVAGELTEEPTPPTDSQLPVDPTTTGIRTQVGEGSTSGGAYWKVWFDVITDERKAYASPASTSTVSIYDGNLNFRCSGNGRTLEVWFSDLMYSGSDDRYTATIRWDSYTPQTRSAYDNAQGGGGHFVSDPQQWVRYANQFTRLVARFTGYSQTATFTYDLASLRELPSWPNILACGTSAQRAAGSSE